MDLVKRYTYRWEVRICQKPCPPPLRTLTSRLSLGKSAAVCCQRRTCNLFCLVVSKQQCLLLLYNLLQCQYISNLRASCVATTLAKTQCIRSNSFFHDRLPYIMLINACVLFLSRFSLSMCRSRLSFSRQSIAIEHVFYQP